MGGVSKRDLSADPSRSEGYAGRCAANGRDRKPLVIALAMADDFLSCIAAAFAFRVLRTGDPVPVVVKVEGQDEVRSRAR